MRRSILCLLLVSLFLFSCTTTDPVAKELQQQYDALVAEQQELDYLLRQVDAKYAMLQDDKKEIAANIAVISRDLETAEEDQKPTLETMANYQTAQEDLFALLERYEAQKEQWVAQQAEVKTQMESLSFAIEECQK